MEYIFSLHAIEELQKTGRSHIREDWIQQTLDFPDAVAYYPNLNKVYHWKRISDYGNRALKVVFNPVKSPVYIITVYFDRGFKDD
ncbi:DUF4258 domain-containing protein [Geminocystis sp. CENA526]|uniref:DUF4258 domain-containing protein n=1 Tax=Geminocystis sp. CENA526 TaxID=1355871 RepID=UPI003D6F2604